MVFKRARQPGSDAKHGFRIFRASRSACAIVALTLFASALPQLAGAHHSVSQFDSGKEVTIDGTVTALEWANPHVWIRLNVADENGQEVEWGVEASNPLDLGRKGWSKKTFQAGDKVSITIHPARNGKPYGSFVKAEMADGKTLEGP